MKTVQLLYSYLLVEKPFNLESQPTPPTKERRFAYNLYLDLIYLMVRIAHEVKGKQKSCPLSQTRFILKAEADEKIKSLKTKYTEGNYPFASIEQELADNIKGSLVFKEFEKSREKGEAKDNLWEEIFNTIIINNSRLNEIIKNLDGYSLSGEERMRELMTKTFQNFNSSKDNIGDALKNLERSLLQARDLYMRLLSLPVELTSLRMEQLESNRNKYLPSTEDLNPNMNFVNNSIASEISENKEFEEYVEKNHLSWKIEDPELLSLLLNKILESDIYSKYIEKKNPDIYEDSEFWNEIFLEIIFNDKNFLEYLENKSVFWNDDLEIIGSFVIKTIKRMANPETKETAIMPMYKDGENGKDSKFGIELFTYVIRNKEIYKSYIEEALLQDKWEAERLAFMDVVIIMTALAEIINYPEIPLQVSINEYVEIAKSYSSAKSGQFVHGLLASILSKLKENGVTMKG